MIQLAEERSGNILIKAGMQVDERVNKKGRIRLI